MNYLAHAYFSFHEPATIVGNLISDFVKGKKQFEYPAVIQKGIRLHRIIDTYTDAHPAIGEAKKIFRPHYRLYAGAFVDVAFDYFIANDVRLFPTEESLLRFVQLTYASLREHETHIPAMAVDYFSRMRQQNWLYNYRFVWGIQKSFGGIVYRSLHLNDSNTASVLFEEHFFRLKECYDHFIPDLMEMVANSK